MTEIPCCAECRSTRQKLWPLKLVWDQLLFFPCNQVLQTDYLFKVRKRYQYTCIVNLLISTIEAHSHKHYHFLQKKASNLKIGRFYYELLFVFNLYFLLKNHITSFLRSSNLNKHQHLFSIFELYYVMILVSFLMQICNIF